MNIENQIIPFYNKLTERVKGLPEQQERPPKELINELQEKTLDLASLVYVLWCRLDEMKAKDL